MAVAGAGIQVPAKGWSYFGATRAQAASDYYMYRYESRDAS